MPIAAQSEHTRASMAVQQNACSVHFEHNAVDLQDFVTPLPVEGDGGEQPGPRVQGFHSERERNDFTEREGLAGELGQGMRGPIGGIRKSPTKQYGGEGNGKREKG